jgi:response regulator RpfG family c-di-GMP phosphodiesterase
MWGNANNKKIVSNVDDGIDITELFRDALCTKMDSLSFITFNYQVDALGHFKRNKNSYALVISDLRMPAMDGLELLKQVKRLNPTVRTMLISAYEFQNNPIFEKFLNEKIINSFLEKPVTIKKLCQRVREEFRVHQLTSHHQ